MIALRGVGKSFGGRALFRGLELTFAPGKTTVITGRSGAGKSTLLRLLNQLERHEQGTVVLDGLEIPAGLPEREWRRRADLLRRRTGMLFQSHHLFPHLTVLQNVMLAPVHVGGKAPAEARSRALALLEQVGLAAAAERYPARLSGGESQRVAIARALAMEPEVLLLDEPTASLDPQSTRDVVAAIQDLRRRGITQVLVTHHPELAAELGDARIDLDTMRRG